MVAIHLKPTKKEKRNDNIILYPRNTRRETLASLSRFAKGWMDGWMDGGMDDEGKFDFDEERHEGANLLIIIKIGGDESFEIHGDGWRERDRRERGKERTRWMFANGHFSLSNVEDEGWKRTRK